MECRIGVGPYSLATIEVYSNSPMKLTVNDSLLAALGSAMPYPVADRANGIGPSRATENTRIVALAYYAIGFSFDAVFVAARMVFLREAVKTGQRCPLDQSACRVGSHVRRLANPTALPGRR